MCRFLDGQRALDLLGLELKVIELQAVISFLIQVLRTGPRSSARVVGNLGWGDGSVPENPVTNAEDLDPHDPQGGSQPPFPFLLTISQ